MSVGGGSRQAARGEHSLSRANYLHMYCAGALDEDRWHGAQPAGGQPPAFHY